MPGPSTISRPFAARMFDAHIRFGVWREGAPATFTVSPTFRLSGVASVRRRMLSELASMSQVTTLPFASFARTKKCTCGFCQATSWSVPSISIVVRAYSDPEWCARTPTEPIRHQAITTISETVCFMSTPFSDYRFTLVASASTT